MNFKSSDAAAAEHDLVLAEAGDRDAGKRLLRRVALGEFHTLAVQLYLRQMADQVLGELAQGKVSEVAFAHALRLDGKRCFGDSITIGRAVMAYMDEGLSQNRAFYLVANDLSMDESKVKTSFNRYRNEVRAIVEMEKLEHLFHRE